MRDELVRQRESFIFETVFSDPAGEKLASLTDADAASYNVVLCFIGISGPKISEERIAMRVSQGGHDVPGEKLVARFPRTIANLRRKLPGAVARSAEDFDRFGVKFDSVSRDIERRPLPIGIELAKSSRVIALSTRAVNLAFDGSLCICLLFDNSSNSAGNASGFW